LWVRNIPVDCEEYKWIYESHIFKLWRKIWRLIIAVKHTACDQQCVVNSVVDRGEEIFYGCSKIRFGVRVIPLYAKNAVWPAKILCTLKKSSYVVSVSALISHLKRHEILCSNFIITRAESGCRPSLSYCSSPSLARSRSLLYGAVLWIGFQQTCKKVTWCLFDHVSTVKEFVISCITWFEIRYCWQSQRNFTVFKPTDSSLDSISELKANAKSRDQVQNVTVFTRQSSKSVRM